MKTSNVRKIAFFALRRGANNQRAQYLLRTIFEQAGVEVYEAREKDSNGRPLLQQGTDIALCFGGDGTMLSLVNQVVSMNCILAGVNMGHLGFLSACSRAEAEMLALAIVRGEYLIDERIILSVEQCDANGVCIKGPLHALNELSLMRAQTGKMIEVDVTLNGERFNRYYADGILVATPTGSSAYSLAAGGPLIWPDSGVMCLTPICPQSLTSRSVVMPDSVEIQLRPRERRGRRHETMIYSMDGRMVHQINLNDTLIIRKAPKTLKLMHLKGSGYAARLRAKLDW